MPPARWLLLATAALLPPPTSSFHGAVPSAVHRRRRTAATTTTALSARPKRGKAESDVAFIKNTELSNDTPETDDEFLSAFFGDAELGFGVTAEDVADAIEDRAAGLVEDREDDLPEAPKAAVPKAARKALPHIAVVGAPNVGKSTLVNRLADGGQTDLSAAITADEPGVTRDRTYREGQWNGYRYQVVDTGGLVFDDKEGETYVDDIKSQAAIALDEAAAAVFVVDGKMGATGFDENVAAWLRRDVCKTTPVMVAVNKCESEMTGDAQAGACPAFSSSACACACALRRSRCCSSLPLCPLTAPPPPFPQPSSTASASASPCPSRPSTGRAWPSCSTWSWTSCGWPTTPTAAGSTSGAATRRTAR